MDELQSLNMRVSVCKRLQKVVNEKAARELQEYIDWVEKECILRERIYDV